MQGEVNSLPKILKKKWYRKVKLSFMPNKCLLGKNRSKGSKVTDKNVSPHHHKYKQGNQWSRWTFREEVPNKCLY